MALVKPAVINIGVPVAPNTVPNTDHLILYYGQQAGNASYTQAGRVDLGALANLTIVTDASGNQVYDDNASALFANSTGTVNVAFTYMDPNSGDESNFSPNLTITIPTVPPAPGQPEVLG